MRIAVTGASGLIGGALVPHLRARGHEVLRLVRRTSGAPDEVTWDPMGGTVDVAGLDGVEAVIHLAGAGVGDHRWTPEYKAIIRESRTAGTATLATALASMDRPPTVLVSGSAIGFYGDTGNTAVDETAPAGSGFRRNPGGAPTHGAGRGRPRWRLGKALATGSSRSGGQVRLRTSVVVVHLVA